MEEYNDEEPPTKRMKTQHTEDPPGTENSLSPSPAFSPVATFSNCSDSSSNAKNDFDDFDETQLILDSAVNDEMKPVESTLVSDKSITLAAEEENSEPKTTTVASNENEIAEENASEDSSGSDPKDNNLNGVTTTDDAVESTQNETTEAPDSPEVQIVKTMRKVGGRTKKTPHMRKNIKDILKTDQLDEETIAAQREEAERRQRMELKQQQLRGLNLLQQQQQQLLHQSMLPMHQGSLSEQLTFEQILRSISKTSTSLSVVPPPTANQMRNNMNYNMNQDDIILSSDEEVENLHSNYNDHPIREGTERQLFRNFGGTVINACEQDDRLISLSSEDEDFDSRKAINKKHDMNNDSDDDCVVISPPPPEDLEEDDKEEKNLDELNVPDHLGRVLINLAHPEGEPDVYLAPQVAQIIKPHQIGGIRFLYDNVVESIERFNTSSGFGCILAHSMGLGKTVQAVSFCDVFLRCTKGRTVLVIVPINTVQNWMNEFDHWIPKFKVQAKPKGSQKRTGEETNGTKHGKGNGRKSKVKANSGVSIDNSPVCSDSLNSDCKLNFMDVLNEGGDDALLKSEDKEPSEKSEQEVLSDPIEISDHIQFRKFDVFVLNETVKTLQARERIISEWGDKGGVLLIGYEMYRMLSLKKLKRSGRKNAFASSNNEKLAQEESLNRIYSYLVNPGPDLVICDEGHRIKNSGASISQALKAIKTKRRIVLTGYPLQNNLMEYWCMVDFVRPNFLGTKVEFSNMFERPIQNGQCADSNVEDKRLMRFRSHVLHSLLEGFVQRRSHIVLQNALPAKQEWVFLLKMSPIQKSLYTHFITYLNEGLESQNASANPIKAFAVCCKIWNHPDALYNVVKKKQSLLDDMDLEEINVERGGGRGRNSKRAPSTAESSPGLPDYYMGFPGATAASNMMSSRAQTSAFRNIDSHSLSLDWALPLFENYVPELLENGVKFKLLFDILKETVDIGDKLLVFSQSLLSLDLIEIFLAQKFQWKKNSQYFRLDGSTTGLEREKLINEFNARDEVFLFLVSTRAGSLGINLIGANRVIVLDASWNPCHDCQAVCRVYRYGQQKQCQIYRFVTDLSLEKRIYDRQINKRGMADRVVDEMNPDSHFRSKDVNSFLVLHHEHLEQLQYKKCQVDPEKYSDLVMRRVLSDENCTNLLTQEPFEHESLLIDQKSQKLSKAEKRLAHRNYEKEKKISVTQTETPRGRASYASFYPKTPPPYYSSHPQGYTPPPYGSFGVRNAYDKPLPYYRPHYSENASYVSDESAMESLREKGICVQHLVLKKDGFMADPAGGPDMYLPAGQKVYVLRSSKGIYLRLESGKIIAVRNNLHFTSNIPPTQDLNTEDLMSVVYSLVKVPGQSHYGRKKSYLNSFPSNHPHNYLSQHPNPHYNHAPPTEQPLPPSNFLLQNQNHLQIKNHHNTSGGDVTVWRSDSNPNSNSNHSNNSSDGQHASDSPHSVHSGGGKTTFSNSGVRRTTAQIENELNDANNLMAMENFGYLKNFAGTYEGPTEFQNPFSNFLSDLTIGKHDVMKNVHLNQQLPSTTPIEQLLNPSGDLLSTSSGIELIPLPSKHNSTNPSQSYGNSAVIPASPQDYSSDGKYWNTNNSVNQPPPHANIDSFFNDFTITPVKPNNNNIGRRGGGGQKGKNSRSSSNSGSSLKSILPWVENGDGRFPNFGRGSSGAKTNGSRTHHERGHLDWLHEEFENPLFAGVTSASSHTSTSPGQYVDPGSRLESGEGNSGGGGGGSSSNSSNIGCNSIRALLERRDTVSNYYSSPRSSTTGNNSRRNSFNLANSPSSSPLPSFQPTSSHNQGM